jgi:hypothetical protein
MLSFSSTAGDHSIVQNPGSILTHIEYLWFAKWIIPSKLKLLTEPRRAVKYCRQPLGANESKYISCVSILRSHIGKPSILKTRRLASSYLPTYSPHGIWDISIFHFRLI